ncbi:hypothetical protein DAPPUDRAFT_241221 [Daphnia pulex]|uniref:Uncharacterized protein n=1 Tax=Daphnia pulex TaxID=6669 RepID=E9GDQ8_DAPPU|nr:hypothetical protein DAPPUDRAFT_241221 [Daphnia pulex]|eukprot:EFX82123.1 hypothetical protein DAPPUDRAFT_241221 [Daphnia pulex]
MSSPFTFSFFVVFYSIWSRFSVLSLSKYNPLNGQHLRVIWPRWSGNPKGLTGPAKSGVIIDYLKDRLNFTYEFVRVTENILEPQGKQRGLISYLLEDVE